MSKEESKTMDILEIVKVRVGISSNVRDDFINTLIQATIEQLEKSNGIVLDEQNIAHNVFLADFVAWRYDNQGNDTMPNYLRIQFNELWNAQGDEK